jgi:hypothetical protein
MKKCLLGLALVIMMIAGCSVRMPKKYSADSKVEFKAFGTAACARGVSNTQIAAIFEEIHNEHGQDSTFSDQLIAYLNNDSCLFGYHYAYSFLHDQNGYTEISDNQLAELVLLNGLSRASQLITEDYAYAKCTFLWHLAVFYFQNDRHEEAITYCQLAFREEATDCEDLIPALAKDEMELFLAFYKNAISP